MKKILIADDDKEIRELLECYLRDVGYAASSVGNGSLALKALDDYQADILILDVMMPGDNGFAVIKKLRQQQRDLPVLMLSAKGEVEDRIQGLELGADDYLPKPFDPRELLIRIRNLLKRESVSKKEQCRYRQYVFDQQSLSLTFDQQVVPLTTMEANLLKALCEHQGSVLSKDHLSRAIKGYEHTPYDRSLDVIVARIRKKLEPFNEPLIQTVWGKGYRLNNEAL